MKTRPLGTISLICLVVTTLWLALFIYGVASKGTVETFEQALVSVVKLDALFYLTYVNAALVTLSATLLFACLYVYCKLTAPEWSAMGLVFAGLQRLEPVRLPVASYRCAAPAGFSADAGIPGGVQIAVGAGDPGMA